MSQTPLFMVKMMLVVVCISVWLFAVFTPSIVTLISEKGKVLTTISLNEEESQDIEKQDVGEKQLVAHPFLLPMSPPTQGAPKPNQYYGFKTFDLATDVVVPPPELLV